MRSQETARILKVARNARHGHEQHENEPRGNAIARAWRAIVSAMKR